MASESRGWQLQPIDFGAGAGALRRIWHGIAGKWALQYVIDQQNGFNEVLGKQVLALEAEQDELRREIARLNSQLQSLRHQLDTSASE